MLLIDDDAVVASDPNLRTRIMNRNRTKDHNLVGANDPQSHELTEAELDFVSGGNSLQYVQAVVTYSAAQMASSNLVKASD